MTESQRPAEPEKTSNVVPDPGADSREMSRISSSSPVGVYEQTTTTRRSSSYLMWIILLIGLIIVAFFILRQWM